MTANIKISACQTDSILISEMLTCEIKQVSQMCLRIAKKQYNYNIECTWDSSAAGLILITLDLDDYSVMSQEPHFQLHDQYFTS